MASELLPTLERAENAVAYDERLVFIDVKEDPYLGRTCHFYLCRDVEHQSLETVQDKRKNNKDKTAGQPFREHMSRGLFMLVSTRRLGREEVLPCHYARQGIEQIFDLSKNESNPLPIRVHSEETMQGHVMVSFLATMASRWLQYRLKGEPEEHEGKGRKPKGKRHIGLRECYLCFRNVKGSLYQDGKLIVTEAQKVANETLSRLKWEMPKQLDVPKE